MNQREIRAVVLQVAVNAILSAGILNCQARVITVSLGKHPRDFFVAVQALKSRRTGPELMTARALGRSR